MLFFVFSFFSLIIALNSHVIKRDDRVHFPDDNEIVESHFDVFELRFNDGSKLESDPDANLNAEFKADLFQGDIMLNEEQESYFNSPKDDEDEGVLFKTGLSDTKYRWKKNSDGKAVMPYVISSEAGFCE